MDVQILFFIEYNPFPFEFFVFTGDTIDVCPYRAPETGQARS